MVVSGELGLRLGGRRRAQLIKRWLDRVQPEDRDRFRTAFDTLGELRRGKVSADVRLTTHDGNHRTFRMRVKPVLGGDGQVTRIVGTLQDVNEERASRDRLLHDAVHDSLTGLPNKQLFIDQLSVRWSAPACRTGEACRLPRRHRPLWTSKSAWAIRRRIGAARHLAPHRAHHAPARHRRPPGSDQFGVIVASSGGGQDRRERRADPQG